MKLSESSDGQESSCWSQKAIEWHRGDERERRRKKNKEKERESE